MTMENEPLEEEELTFTDEDYENPMDLGDEPVDLSQFPVETLNRFVGPPLVGEEETLREAEERVKRAAEEHAADAGTDN